MAQTIFYETFAFNPVTGQHDIWLGTATIAEVRKRQLYADFSYPLYGEESFAIGGWAYKTKY